ncbi:MAG: VOC family protein [Bacteroidota bacterium]
MKLGKFSLSIRVKDINSSIVFYQTLGFKIIDGGHINRFFKDTPTLKWRILEHPSVKIGLFQGMFDTNMLTFHPEDVIKIQNDLKKSGIELSKEAKVKDSSMTLLFSDPDGNTIMMEQIPDIR